MNNSRPHLLFIMTDHQRYDSLGMTQAGGEVCPSVNRLAAQSTSFSRAYNMCPLCAPARTAMSTGKYPTSVGLTWNDFAGLTAKDHKPLEQYLHEAGYELGHVGIDHVKIKPAVSERVPFSVWVDVPSHSKYLKDNGITEKQPEGTVPFTKPVETIINGEAKQVRYSSVAVDVWPHSAEHFKDSYWGRVACDFLKRRHDKPFALFVYLWAPHPPLVLPEPHFSMFDPANLDLPSNVPKTPEGEPASRRRSVPRQLAEGVSMAHWRKVWSAHLGLVNLVDNAIGNILNTLSEQGLADETVTLFTVDHGDHLGQHTLYQKMEMYEPAVHIPLLVRVPGVAPQTFEGCVSHLDIMPTVMDLLSVPKPDDLEGDSLAEAIRSRKAPTDKTVFSQYSGTLSADNIRRSAITRQYKYTYDPNDIAELYDLEDDPLEMTNLAQDPGYAEVVAKLHAETKAWHETHGDWVDY